MDESLQQFHPVIGAWFEEALGLPTPPQRLGWPSIIAGKSTLILAPTGSGKTLAAFLAAIDAVAKRLLAEADDPPVGVQILYVSPLKALANDVRKNLLRPLEEMAAVAGRMGEAWPEIKVGIRHGDTPQRERAGLARNPPHILVTTPESLNLILMTGARQAVTGVRYVIVDEAHALAGNKRGVFLSAVLERLERERENPSVIKGARKIAPGVYKEVGEAKPLVRIGLSATAAPEETVGRWLCGYDAAGAARGCAIVRAGQRKRLDLAVVCPAGDFEEGESDGKNADEGATVKGRSHWPEVTAMTMRLIREHTSTLVFANSRRMVETLTSRLQEQADAPRMLPHHGSIAKNVRLETEEALKKGELSAVIATASLELGIDVGALDLVVQIDSPGNVTAALQRVGRAGHLEKATAKGRLLARGISQLAALAALVPLMLEGKVEPTVIPENCLDVLAQMIVAACAVRAWDRKGLFQLFKRCAAYRNLGEDQFDTVVAMLARRGEYTGASGLKPKISWDKVNDQLMALPGAAKLALTNGGTIADTGQFPVYAARGAKTGAQPEENERDRPYGVRIGELDEEFVFETKEGDRVLLGSQLWRVLSIDADRVIVARSEPGPSRMPFWRGESAPRSELVADAMAELSRELEERLKAGEDGARDWLMEKYHLEMHAAESMTGFYQRQRAMAGVPTNTRIIVEHFRDKSGEPVIAVLCPWGGRVNLGLRLALEARFADKRLGIQITHTDDGLMMRPPVEAGMIPDNPLAFLAAETVEHLVVDQLESSAMFGVRFRQNAARSLMLPRVNPAERTPLWQQRSRARHLLALVKRERNFPIVLETYRECLREALDMERVRRLLADIDSGKVEVKVVRAADPARPSPMTRGMAGSFEYEYMYAGDDPMGVGAGAEPAVDLAALDAILQRRKGPEAAASWSPEDEATLQRRIDGSDYPARTAEELLERIAAVGAVDLGFPGDEGWKSWAVEDAGEMLERLLGTHRVVVLDWQDERGMVVGKRWVATESLAPYLKVMGGEAGLWTYLGGELVKLDRAAIPAAFFHTEMTREQAEEAMVSQAVRRRAITVVGQLEETYPFMRAAVGPLVAAMVRSGMLTQVDAGRVAPVEHVEQLRHIALRRQRKGASCADVAALQRHLIQWHRIGTAAQEGSDAVEDTLERLSGVRLPLETWLFDVMPARVKGFGAAQLERVCGSGYFVAVGSAERRVSFWPRHLLSMRGRDAGVETALTAEGVRVLGALGKAGASYEVDLEILLPGMRGSVKPVLAELFFAGLVSNDSLGTLRAALDAPAEGTGGAANRGVRYPAKMQGRTFRGLGRQRRAEAGLGGRWFVLPAAGGTPALLGTAGGTPALLGAAGGAAKELTALELAERATERVERLLRRHGFACRELADAAVDGTWRSCYEVLTRMEWAGTIRRGYFVEGITGSQFMVPGVALGDGTKGSGEVVWLSMLDPANMYGHLEAKWFSDTGQPARVPRTAGSWLALVQGRPVLAAVSYGQRLIALEATAEEHEAAVRAVGELVGRMPEAHRTLRVRYWGPSVGEEGDASILGSPYAEVLREVGFARDTQTLRMYRSYGGG